MFDTLFRTRVVVFCFSLSVSYLALSFVSFCPFVSGRRTPSSIFCNVALVVIIFLSFCINGKLFISPYLQDNFAGYLILG